MGCGSSKKTKGREISTDTDHVSLFTATRSPTPDAGYQSTSAGTDKENEQSPSQISQQTQSLNQVHLVETVDDKPGRSGNNEEQLPDGYDSEPSQQPDKKDLGYNSEPPPPTTPSPDPVKGKKPLRKRKRKKHVRKERQEAARRGVPSQNPGPSEPRRQQRLPRVAGGGGRKGKPPPGWKYWNDPVKTENKWRNTYPDDDYF